jgi:hypothetical protein
VASAMAGASGGGWSSSGNGGSSGCATGALGAGGGAGAGSCLQAVAVMSSAAASSQREDDRLRQDDGTTGDSPSSRSPATPPGGGGLGPLCPTIYLIRGGGIIPRVVAGDSALNAGGIREPTRKARIPANALTHNFVPAHSRLRVCHARIRAHRYLRGLEPLLQ